MLGAAGIVTHILFCFVFYLAENTDGETPLDVAESKKFDECIELVST